jgi:branched-subunit amino acid transport protein
MTLWLAIILGSLAVYSWKILGYLVPTSVLDHPKVAKLASLLTVALLSALTGVQALTAGSQISFDARIPALGVAAILLVLRAPFIVTVACAAGAAALLRLWLGA